MVGSGPNGLAAAIVKAGLRSRRGRPPIGSAVDEPPESGLVLADVVPRGDRLHVIPAELPYTKEELTGVAESSLRDFPVGECPYMMEHLRQHVADRP